MSGFKGFALVNSKKYGSRVNGVSKFDSDEPGGLPVKVTRESLELLPGELLV